MVNNEMVQELFKSAIALVEHDGYSVCGTISPVVTYNHRTTAYGLCHYERCGGSIRSYIRLSKFFVDGATEKQVFQVLVHEVLHACFPGDGHKGRWKAAADRISTIHPDLKISRTDCITNECGKEILSEQSAYKRHDYTVCCDDCKRKWTYKNRARKPRVVAHPEIFHCAYCGGNITVIEL